MGSCFRGNDEKAGPHARSAPRGSLTHFFLALELTCWRSQAANSAPGRLAFGDGADLASAMAKAKTHTPRGGVIRLSPGAPSFDQFKDYAERGRRFAELAGFYGASITGIEGLGIG